MSETCVFMNIPHFQGQMKWCQSYFTKMYMKANNIENWDTVIPRVTWCVANFVHPTTLTFRCDFKCTTFLAKCDIGNLVCTKNSYTMTWHEEKTDLKCAWHFLRRNKNSPREKQLFGGTVYKNCMLCTFRCTDTILLWKWSIMDVGQSKTGWCGNNGCHMSQENVIKFWVAWNPSFPDSYSV